MAFGDNVMLKFYSSEPRDTGPAYEEVGDIDDLDDEVFSMIDQMTKSTESVDSGLGDETDTDDNPDEYDGGDDDVYADDEFDEDDDDECDDEFDDCDDDDLEFDEECTESGIADQTPEQRFVNFKKMVMANSKWSPEKKKEIINNYIQKHGIKAEAVEAALAMEASTYGEIAMEKGLVYYSTGGEILNSKEANRHMTALANIMTGKGSSSQKDAAVRKYEKEHGISYSPKIASWGAWVALGLGTVIGVTAGVALGALFTALGLPILGGIVSGGVGTVGGYAGGLGGYELTNRSKRNDALSRYERSNESLSDIGCLDDEILDDSPLNKIINMSYDFYDDALYPEHAEYASNLKSGSHDLDDELEALLDDVLGFDGDSTAKHSASLKSGTKRYAGESAIDNALETLLNGSNIDSIDEALESLLGANESYVGSKAETDIVAKVKRMVKDYKAMPAGSAKKGYGTRIAKLITPKKIVRTLEKYGEWDKIPSELKGGHNARVANQAVKDGIKYDKRKAKEASKKLKSGLEGLGSYNNTDAGVWYSTGGQLWGREANKHLDALRTIQGKGLSEEKQVQAIVDYERKYKVSFTRRELQGAGLAGAVIGAVLAIPVGSFAGAIIGADIGSRIEHNKELDRAHPVEYTLMDSSQKFVGNLNRGKKKRK